jgi:hypothetical protein
MFGPLEGMLGQFYITANVIVENFEPELSVEELSERFKIPSGLFGPCRFTPRASGGRARDAHRLALSTIDPRQGESPGRPSQWRNRRTGRGLMRLQFR